MNITKSFILFVSASAFIATASVALASPYNAKLGDAPLCPKPSSLPVITDVFGAGAGAGAGTAWAGQTRGSIGPDFPLGVYELFYTQDIVKNTALVRAKEIEKSADSVVERYNDLGFFYTCEYKIDHKYVSNGDRIDVFSKNYDSNGQPSQTQLSNAEKFRLFNMQNKIVHQQS